MKRYFFCTTVKNGRNKCVTNIRKIISQEFQGIFLKFVEEMRLQKSNNTKKSEVLQHIFIFALKGGSQDFLGDKKVQRDFYTFWYFYDQNFWAKNN